MLVITKISLLETCFTDCKIRIKLRKKNKITYAKVYLVSIAEKDTLPAASN